MSRVALLYGDAETASGSTRRHQNASSEASTRYSHSMASVPPSHHSSYAQFSAPSRIECRQVTPCHASPASETKAGTSLPGPMKKLFHPLSHLPEPSFHPFHTAQDRRAFPIMRLEGHRRPAKVRRCAEKPYPRRALWKNRSLVAASWRAAPPYRA